MTEQRKTIVEEVANLKLHEKSSAHPAVLLKFPMFTPSPRVKKANGRNINASNELNKLEFASRYGYKDVIIIGDRLNMEVDFKVWCGLIKVINDNDFKELIEVDFISLLKDCGYKKHRINAALRKTVEQSFFRIASQTIKFSNSDKGKDPLKFYAGSLINEILVDEEKNFVKIKINTSLVELYRIDYVALLQLPVLAKLTRQESAQCLFIYLASLPKNPFDIEFKTLRERLNLTSASDAEQNRTVTKAIDKLKEIGYLDAEIYRKKNNRYLKINDRCQYLTLAKISEMTDIDRAKNVYDRIVKMENLEKINKKDIKVLEMNMAELMMDGYKFDDIIQRIKTIKQNLIM